MTVKNIYISKQNPSDSVRMNEDCSCCIVGEFEITDPQLWDMADGLEVEGFTKKDFAEMMREAIAAE